jgi:hypothetical protein
MKLLLEERKIVSNSHTWKRSSDEFAHMNGVSWVAWCTKCGCEAIPGQASKDKCTYYDNLYLDEWNGESDICCSESQIKKAENKIKSHMLRVLRKYKILNLKDFQGTTAAAGRVYFELRDEGFLEELDYKGVMKTKVKYTGKK